MKAALTLTIVGAAGRMGRQLLELVADCPDLTAVSLWESDGHGLLGQVEPSTGLTYVGNWSGIIGDVVIDFTNREGLLALLDEAPANGFALVSGSTGLSEADMQHLVDLSHKVPVFHASNMSIGIYVLHQLVQQAVTRVGPDWDVELVEMHHRRKKDAPSGTALSLAQTASAAARGLRQVHGRSGETGSRKSDELGVMALRGGDVVGEHELILAGPGEVLRLKHSALSRTVFAAGAVEAARWVSKQQPGLYSMSHMMSDRKVDTP